MTLSIELQATPLNSDQDGVLRVGGTRVTLETVIHRFNEGHTAEDIVSHYPALRLADVYSVIAYYLNNQEDVHAYLKLQEKNGQAIRKQIEAKTDYQDFRKRLLARRQN